MREESVHIHGKPASFTRGGTGPPIVLIHGITSSARTWAAVEPLLETDHTVIAPDLAGHGHSAKPRGDYSLGAHASGIRDLLSLLGVRTATIVGHSLGGGIAMQFAYQFPERVERLVLVDSGGLGNDVSLVLRAATLPGAEYVMPVLFSRVPMAVGAGVTRTLRRVGIGRSAGARGLREGLKSLGDAEGRRAFLHTARAVIDPAGQRIDARDRLYLSDGIPSLLVWGDRDPIIPVEHGREAHRLMPGSRLVEFPGAGHFPHVDDPERFAALLRDFVASTEPAVYDDAVAGDRLRSGPARSPRGSH